MNLPAFTGECFSVRLERRGMGSDTHICIEIFTEDDGNWFPSRGSFSSAWLPELVSLLSAAQAWLEANCAPDIHRGIQYGWKLK